MKVFYVEEVKLLYISFDVVFVSVGVSGFPIPFLASSIVQTSHNYMHDLHALSLELHLTKCVLMCKRAPLLKYSLMFVSICDRCFQPNESFICSGACRKCFWWEDQENFAPVNSQHFGTDFFTWTFWDRWYWLCFLHHDVNCAEGG